MPELENFKINACLSLLNPSLAGLKLVNKNGTLKFDSDKEAFTLILPMKEVQLLKSELLPLPRKQCPNGNCYVFPFNKLGLNEFREVSLRQVSSEDKQRLHNCLLKLVGVKTNVLTKMNKGNTQPLASISNEYVGPASTIKMETSESEDTPARPFFPTSSNAHRNADQMVVKKATSEKARPLSSISLNGPMKASGTVLQSQPTKRDSSTVTHFAAIKKRKLEEAATVSQSALTEIQNMDRVSQVEPSVDELMEFQKPDDEDKLPEHCCFSNFWKKIGTDGKLRTGAGGEWVVGQAERLTIEGLLCLRDGNWLNADTIDAYLSIICERHTSVRYIPTYGILSYSRKKKLPSEWYWHLNGVDIVLAPAHLNNNHWAMAVVDMRERRITTMDSMTYGFMTSTKTEFMELIRQILWDVAEREGVDIGGPDSWTMTEQFEVPQQENGIDCGIFALLYAKYSAERRHFNFGQEHIPYFRRKICHDILEFAKAIR